MALILGAVLMSSSRRARRSGSRRRPAAKGARRERTARPGRGRGRAATTRCRGSAPPSRSRTLPKEEWTHRAHLLVALWFASRLPPEEALDAMRAASSGSTACTASSPRRRRGYHETITRAYMRLRRAVRRGRGAAGGVSWAVRVARLLARHGERDHPAPVLHPRPAVLVRRLGSGGWSRISCRSLTRGRLRPRRAHPPSARQQCRRSLVIRRRTEPSCTRSPTRTTAPPRIAGST